MSTYEIIIKYGLVNIPSVTIVRCYRIYETTGSFGFWSFYSLDSLSLHWHAIIQNIPKPFSVSMTVSSPFVGAQTCCSKIFESLGSFTKGIVSSFIESSFFHEVSVELVFCNSFEIS